MEELKPCPFCGHVVHIMIRADNYYFAECQGSDECAGAMMDECAYGTKQELIKAWNTRHPSDQWVSVKNRLPDDKIEKFTGGPEGSWGIGVLIITECHPQKGIRKLFAYFDKNDNSFWHKGEKVNAKWWMVEPQPPQEKE